MLEKARQNSTIRNIISRKITKELYTEKIGQDNTTEIFKLFTQLEFTLCTYLRKFCTVRKFLDLISVADCDENLKFLLGLYT